MTTETSMTEVTTDLTEFSKSFFNPSAEPVAETTTEAPAAEEETVETDVSGVEETANEADEGVDDETPKPKKRTTADRIKKLAMDRARQAEELAALRQELEALKTGKALTEDKAADKMPVGPEKPKPENYQYGELDPKYIEDLADYRADLKIAQFQAKLREQQEQERQQEAERRASATLQEKAAEIERIGSSKFDDFHEKVVEGGQMGEYPLTKEMFELASETSSAPDILYYLASYPDEAERVSRMSFTQQALWFGRLEAEIKAATSTPAPKKVTAAPPPPASMPKGSGSKSGPSLTDLNDPRALDLMTKALFG